MRRSLFQSAPLNGVPLFRNVHCVNKAFVSGTLGFVVSGSCVCGTVALVANRSSHSVAPASSAFCKSSRNTVTKLGQYASNKTQRRTFCRVPRQDLVGNASLAQLGLCLALRTYLVNQSTLIYSYCFIRLRRFGQCTLCQHTHVHGG